MAESKTFWCANKDCRYLSRQPIEKNKQELEGYRLCEDCYGRGFRLRHGVVVYRNKQEVRNNEA